MAINAGVSQPMIPQREAGETVDHTLGRAALAFYYLFQVVFSFTYTPLQGVVPAEALETTTRAKGLALSGIVVNCMVFINQFAGPIALGNIGYVLLRLSQGDGADRRRYKYIWVYVGWACVEALFWYLFW